MGEEIVEECKPVSKKHVKTVEEEVCKDVLLDVVETICDGDNISSKNGGKSNGDNGDIGNIDSYGPPKAPLTNNGKNGNDNNIDSYGPPKAPLYTEKPTEGNNSNGQGNRNHSGHDNDDDNNNSTDDNNSKCREVARKKVEKVCKVEAKEVIEWRKEEVCAKVPKNA